MSSVPWYFLFWCWWVARIFQSNLHFGSALSLQGRFLQKTYAGWDTEYLSLPCLLFHVCSGQHCQPGPASKQIWKIYADTWFYIWKCRGSVRILSVVVMFFLSQMSKHLAGKHLSFQTPRAFQHLTFWKLNGFKCSGHKVKFSRFFTWKNSDLCRSATC